MALISVSLMPTRNSSSSCRALPSASICTSLLWGMHAIAPMSSCSYNSLYKTRLAVTATSMLPVSEPAAASKAEKSQAPPQRQARRMTHPISMSPEKVELFKSLDGWVETNILPLLKPVELSWQPQDFLPEPSSEGFWDEVQALRARSSELPDEYLVCLVGDMITEEALPTYQSMLNRTAGISDETGASLSSWARWTRAWTAEENRHGDLLNKYLYLTGRVDMRAIERTIQYLIGSGMDPQTENSPYLGFIYTSFQERATFISHRNTAKQAKHFGDTKLAQICGVVAGDERRHEAAYSRVVEKLFEVDAECTMVALEEMMRRKIVMPAHLMYDGHDGRLFGKFAGVAQKTGVYTVKDYADVVEHLVEGWGVEKVEGLSGRGQQAQEYVCGLAHRMRRADEFTRNSKAAPTTSTATSFSWIFNRRV